MKPEFISSVSIQGFRGFLEKVTLPFSNGSQKMSICIWGDNGTGKSSFADGVEFFFDPKGIVERLGEKSNENKGGLKALPHARAGQRGIASHVSFELLGGQTIQRRLTGADPQKLPEETQKLMATVPAPLVLRAADMRSFVADKTGAERYELLSKWVGLDRLTGLLDDLTKTEKKAGALSRKEAKLEKQKDLVKLTGGKLSTWETASALSWVNSDLLMDLGPEFKVASARDLRALEGGLTERAKGGTAQTEAVRYRGLIVSLQALEAGSGDSISSRYGQAENDLGKASRELEEAKRKHARADVKDVLSAARSYLVEHKTDSCPVCLRAFDAKVTQAEVLRQIDEALETLAAVGQAERALTMAASALGEAVRALLLAVSDTAQKLASVSDPGLEEMGSRMDSLQKEIAGWLNDSSASGKRSGNVASALAAVQHLAIESIALCAGRAEALEKDSEVSWGELLASVKQLRAIGNRWVEIDREEAALVRVAEQFKEIAGKIREAVRNHVKAIVAGLQSDVRAIYADLRQNDEHIPEIEMLVSEKKAMNVEMSLFGVPRLVPSGYLSDSQLNSLGLALFLAAVRKFNGDFPFIVLDDIMSSYDASHRLNLIEVVRKHLSDFQVLITTHDEPFFREARGVLSQTGKWQFYRLKPWLLETGVRIAGTVPPEEEIEQRIQDGEKPQILAGMVLDQLENWLQGLCAKKGSMMKVRVRSDGSFSDPTLKDFLESAQPCFTGEHRKHASYAFVAAHGLLNWPRHVSTGKKMNITNAEIQTFWKHFQTFRRFHESSL